MNIDDNWTFVAACVDGQSLLIDGIDVWKHAWHDTKDLAHVKDPKYHQDFAFHVFEIRDGDSTIQFAAGEFSNCVWGFYQKPQIQPAKLPREFSERASQFPECHMGTNRVTLRLKNGEVIRDVYLAWGEEIVRIGDKEVRGVQDLDFRLSQIQGVAPA